MRKMTALIVALFALLTINDNANAAVAVRFPGGSVFAGGGFRPGFGFGGYRPGFTPRFLGPPLTYGYGAGFGSRYGYGYPLNFVRPSLNLGYGACPPQVPLQLPLSYGCSGCYGGSCYGSSCYGQTANYAPLTYQIPLPQAQVPCPPPLQAPAPSCGCQQQEPVYQPTYQPTYQPPLTAPAPVPTLPPCTEGQVPQGTYGVCPPALATGYTALRGTLGGYGAVPIYARGGRHFAYHAHQRTFVPLRAGTFHTRTVTKTMTRTSVRGR